MKASQSCTKWENSKIMLKRKIITIVILLQISLLGFSQTKVLEGQVTAFNKYTLPNIELVAKKSKAKTTTDENGYFKIEIKKKDVIKINNSMFYSFEEKVTDKTKFLEVNLLFEENENNIEKAINKGYFTKEDLDYALVNLAKENNIYALFTDVYEAIKTAIPEASMVETTGGHRAFILRGITSISGNNYAIYVVNGSVTNNISYLPPAEIKRIWKLPNSQSAMYGSQAANGVICIETF